MVKCNGLDRHLKMCRNNVLANEKFCESHQYMKDYTDDMLKNLKICSDCKKAYNFTNDDKTCENCKNRAKINREKQKQNNVLCKFCKSKAIENGHCGNHRRQYIMEQAEKQGIKLCAQFIRGCTNQLELNDGYKNCYSCRVKNNRKKPPHTIKKVPDVDMSMRLKFCSGCRKRRDIEASYESCKECRDKTQIRNNLVKIKNDKLPKCVFPGCTHPKKDIYGNFCGDHRGYNDPEKFKYIATDDNFKICSHCNNKMIPECFIENHNEYKSCITCRKTMRRTDLKREPRHMRFNIQDKIWDIKRSAVRRDIVLDIDDENLEKLLGRFCTYCGNESTGIDRIDNNHRIGYTLYNVVSACKICNCIKYVYDVDNFLKYCLNIYNHIGSKIKNETDISYNKYSKFVSSNNGRKNIKILISENEYIKKFKYKCFYCAGSNINDVLGIDRIDSLGNYTDENTIAACKICNYMKNDHDIVFFFNHIKKILFHNKLIDNLNKSFRIDAPKNDKISSVYIIGELLKIMNEYHTTNKILDHRDIKNFLHDEKYYYNMIYNTYDINKFQPELEFCVTTEQMDIWKYYRLRISSHPYQQSYGRLVEILIRDKLTKKYVGIASLSSELLHCTKEDDYIGWNNNDKLKKYKKDNVMNISTCVGIPPFSFNYNGGKLIAKLMFSQETYDFVLKKYNDKLVALSTYSLHGKSIQYDRLNELKYLGLTEGYGSSHINSKLYRIITRYMDQNNIGENKLFRSRLHRIKCLCNHLGIRDITFHGNQRGVYFGYLGSNGKDFLTSKTDEFIPDMIKTVDEIYNDWKNRWAVNRFENLISNNKIMIDYTFQNYTNNKEYNLWRVHKYLLNKSENTNTDTDKKYTTLTDNDKKIIINKWYYNQSMSYDRIATMVSKELNKVVDRRAISRVVKV